MDILVTNNPIVREQYQSRFRVDFLETDVSGVFLHVRDLIHKGHQLLTHPLTGSIKPNETLYKSVLLTEKTDRTDFKSVGIIEGCIQTGAKFSPQNIREEHKNDMQLVDLSLIRSALDR